MPEAKQNPVKKHSNYFPDNEDSIIMNGDSKLADEFSLDLLNKFPDYIPVIILNREWNEGANAIGFNGLNYLSEYTSPQKENMNEDRVQLLLKRLFTNEQTGHIIKSNTRKKTRLLVKRGVAHIALHLSNIAVIYTKDKLVYVIDCDSKKYCIDKTLTQLEEELDTNIFFRANRQYIINLNFIKSFKAYQKVKLLVDMSVPELEEPIIISQLVAPTFKKWMNDA